MIKIAKIYIVSAAVVFFLILVVLAATLYFSSRLAPSAPISAPVVSAPVNSFDGQAAEALALVKAKEWRPDVGLAYMTSEAMTSSATESWRLIYVSPALKGRGYEIKINNKQIVSAEEIDYTGQGVSFPVETKITQEQAIARVKNMPGYEKAEIISVNAVYGVGTKTWYWGIKTSKGVVSVEMK